MAEFTDRELIRYVLGDARPELASAIEEQAKTDRALADELDLLSLGTGAAMPPTEGWPAVLPARPAHTSPLRHLRAARRWLVAASLLLVVAGTAWAAYTVLAPRPLLQENFDREWIDPTKWDIRRGRPGIRAIDGYLRLRNRGSLVTFDDFREPVEIAFDWRWLDHAEEPLYAEHLEVALRTTGRHKATHNFLILDGVIVQLHVRTGQVRVYSRAEPEYVAVSPDGSAVMPADRWHHVRITDDGTIVSVYLSGPQIDRMYATTPLVQARPPGAFSSHRIAFYNREIVSKATHESHIDNIVIRRLRPKDQK